MSLLGKFGKAKSVKLEENTLTKNAVQTFTPKRRHTVYDISRLADVSVGTVSRVLNNSDKVHANTRQKVLRVARSLGCRPRTAVRPKQIALIVEPPHRTIAGGFSMCLTHHVIFGLAKRGLGMSLVTEDEIGSLSRRLFDGVIAVAWFPKTVKRLEALDNTPIVWIDRMDLKDKFHGVATNHFEAGQMVGNYLLDRGHRRLAMIVDVHTWASAERIRGLHNAMRRRGVDPDKRLIIHKEDQPLYVPLQNILKMDAEALWMPDENMSSVEAVYLLQEVLKVRIPEDISLIGGELPSISQFLRPRMTATAQPLQAMAERAIELVLDLMDRPLDKPETVLLPNEIIERDSVKDKNQKHHGVGA